MGKGTMVEILIGHLQLLPPSKTVCYTSRIGTEGIEKG